MSISSAINFRRDWIDKIDKNVMPFVEYPGYDYRYPAIDTFPISSALASEIKVASEKLYKIFEKVTTVFQSCGDKFLDDMDIPQNMIPYLKQTNELGCPTWLSRFDFVFDKSNNIKMIEINADTPCAVIEAFYGNGIAVDDKHNPNYGEYEQLKSFLLEVFNKIYIPEFNLGNGKISTLHPFVFSCFDDYIEDKGTTMFLMNAMKEAVGTLYPDNMIVFESFYNLLIDESDNSIVLPDGRKPAAIYRLHPLELLIDEVAPDGTRIGEMLLEGYKNGKFTMFNPPESIIMQNKAFQAFVWMLATNDSETLTKEEKEDIFQYMLPSYFERDFNYSTKGKFICKPIWGREGNGIYVINDGRKILEKCIDNQEDIVQRDSSKMLIQEFVGQPEYSMRTDEGIISGYITLSCFMLKDTSSALYARFSPAKIAGTEAYWAALKKEDF